MNFKRLGWVAGACLVSLWLSTLPVKASPPVKASFQTDHSGLRMTLRGVEAIKLRQADSKAFAEFTLEKRSAGSLWVYVFFPWFNQSGVKAFLDDRALGTVGAMAGGGLWNSGNIDVWHWIPVFRGTLEKGRHRVRVDASAEKGPVIASLVWTDALRPWEETWLSGAEAGEALKKAKAVPVLDPLVPEGGTLRLEAEDGLAPEGSDTNDRVTLTSDEDVLTIPFRLRSPFKGPLWIRVFFEWKNNYEGWTLDELSNTGHLFLDGELKKTLWGEDGFHWRWYRVDQVDLGPGSHVLTFKKRGCRVEIDRAILYSGKDFRKESWFGVGPSKEPEIDPFFRNAGYPGQDGPMTIAARLPTGFGVPGNGYPRFLRDNLLLLPGGEGTVTLVDVSKPREPGILNYGLNWYFNHELFPFGNGFYLNSTHRGVYYAEGATGKNQSIRFRLVVLDCARFGRFGALFPDAEPFPVAVTSGGDGGGAVMDISEPLYPKVVGTVEGYRERGFLLSQDGLTGGVIDGEGNLGLILFKDPLKAAYRPIFKAPHAMVNGLKKGARLIGLSGNFIFLRLGSTITVYRRQNSGAAAIGTINLSKGAGSFIKAYEYGGFIHIIDGIRGPGQYSLHYGSRHSQWQVYDPEDLATPLFTYRDPFPTAYGYTTFRSEKAYVFDYNYGLWIFDLKDPKRPEKIGGISSAGEGHYLHVLDNDILCLGQTFGGTLKIIDVREPLKPKLISEFWDGSWFSYDTAAHTDLMTGKGTVLFLPKPGKGIQMIDLQNPYKARVLGFIQGRKCRIIGKRLYSIEGKDLLVYDVNKEREPHLLGAMDTGQTNLTMAIDHPRQVWLSDGKDIKAVDVSEPAQMTLKGHWKNRGDKRFRGGLYYQKGYLYGSFGEDRRNHEIATLDVRDPARITLVNTRNWQAQGLHSRLNDTWANFYRGDFIGYGPYVLASNYSRVEMYDVADPLNPKNIQMLNTGFQWSAGRIKKGFLFVPTLTGLVVVRLK